MDFVQSLPTEISRNIFSFLSGEDLWRTLYVSPSWSDIANDDILWKKICLECDIDFELERFQIVAGPTFKVQQDAGTPLRNSFPRLGRKVENDCYYGLCRYAKIWGTWRWKTVQNWEANAYCELDLETKFTSDYNITTNGDCLALSDGVQMFVLTKRNSRVETLLKEFHTDCVIRTIEMNKHYLVVLKNNCVVVYRTSDYKPYLLINFVNGKLEFIRDDFSSQSTPENSSVEFVLLHDHSLWMGEHLFLKSTVIVNLQTGEFREVSFPWKCTLMRINENVIAVTEKLLAVYSLTGEKSFEMKILDYNLLHTSKSVLALITDSEILIYNRLTGNMIGLIKKVFFEFHINYKRDLIYGLSKTSEKSKVVIEAISLLTGSLLWSIKQNGELESQIRQILGVFLCYTFPHSEYLYILDRRTGKMLQKKRLPRHSWVSFASDLFLVWQTPSKITVRIY